MVTELDLSTIAGYLKSVADLSRSSSHLSDSYKYKSLSEAVLIEGEDLSKEPFTERERNYLFLLFGWHGRAAKMKSCYQTAANLAMTARYMADGVYVKENFSDFTFEYGEGFGVDNTLGIGFPFEHAVFVLNGKPVDIVWRPDQRKGAYAKSERALLKRAEHCQQTNDYYMIRFPIEYMEKVVCGKGTYGVIEFNRELVEKGKEAWKSYLNSASSNGSN